MRESIVNQHKRSLYFQYVWLSYITDKWLCIMLNILKHIWHTKKYNWFTIAIFTEILFKYTKCNHVFHRNELIFLFLSSWIFFLFMNFSTCSLMLHEFLFLSIDFATFPAWPWFLFSFVNLFHMLNSFFFFFFFVCKVKN